MQSEASVDPTCQTTLDSSGLPDSSTIQCRQNWPPLSKNKEAIALGSSEEEELMMS